MAGRIIGPPFFRHQVKNTQKKCSQIWSPEAPILAGSRSETLFFVICVDGENSLYSEASGRVGRRLGGGGERRWAGLGWARLGWLGGMVTGQLVPTTKHFSFFMSLVYVFPSFFHFRFFHVFIFSFKRFSLSPLFLTIALTCVRSVKSGLMASRILGPLFFEHPLKNA